MALVPFIVAPPGHRVSPAIADGLQVHVMATDHEPHRQDCRSDSGFRHESGDSRPRCNPKRTRFVSSRAGSCNTFRARLFILAACDQQGTSDMRALRGTAAAESEIPRTPFEESDEVHVARAQRDPVAFGALFDRYWDPVFRFCYYRTGNWHVAEDAASQVFINALAAIPRFTPSPGRAGFRCWLFTIARNVVTDAHTRNTRQHTDPIDAVPDLISSDPGPEELALDAERHRCVRSLLLQVPPDQRELLELRLSGLTSVEVAATLGRTPAAVRTAQHRAIETLRALVGAGTEYEDLHV
jgi:RNA polymerase sigma-70 factor, ECF subfamily